ncbi:MAG: DNA topoisomerase IV subunit A [Alphaproteobacteria bacterium]|nr:DNA topoisomerase IV subunit A [Alphaproteobacteria bacterium]
MTALPPAGDIRPEPFADALGRRYLSYALSTIMARSLPDVRDGLKPVHRRLLHAMRDLGLNPAAGFKKCARVVGDVMGKYHPHGDAAIYDAMVRLAQEFSVRYPLVEGHGNFGNIDGDNAAAMRYTEARLTAVAEALLAGIAENAVDFRATYDGEGEEPVVLPAAFPNLLANGAQGIAVGMATNIPPHNAGEICEALLYLIRHPKAGIEKLVEFMPGPDFPTGGMLCESPETVAEAYAKGRGSLRLRARWQVEELGRGNWQIVVTEIPYQVPKARLVEKIAELLEAKKLLLLDDLRDESTEDVRLVLVPRARTVEPAALMESLFRQSELEIRFALNMNVLDANQVPRVMSLREVLQAFLDHRHVVLVRRTEFRLAAIARRLEILAGYLIAYAHLDAIIAIIRQEDEPKPILMRRFELSDMQAEAILNMRLRALRRLEEQEIRVEHKALAEEQKELTRLLKDEGRRWTRIGDEIKDMRARYGAATPLGRRRTEIVGPPDPVEMRSAELVEREPVTVICSDKGWIRSVRGHIPVDSDIKYKEGDREKFRVLGETTDKLIVLATNGRFYTLGVDKLPGGRGHGEPLRLMIDLANDEELVVLFMHRPGRRLLVASGDGRGFVVPEDEVLAQTRNGRQVMNLAQGVEALRAVAADGDTVAVLGENRKLLLFPLAEVPELARGRGVILQKYKDGGLADIKTFNLADGLTWRSGERTRTETQLGPWLANRAQAGRLPPHGFPRANRFG